MLELACCNMTQPRCEFVNGSKAVIVGLEKAEKGMISILLFVPVE